MNVCEYAEVVVDVELKGVGRRSWILQKLEIDVDVNQSKARPLVEKWPLSVKLR